MKFFNYLKENRTITISKEEAIDIINKNCSNNIKVMDQKLVYIYRGINSLKIGYGYTNSNTGNPRVSANTHNFMTLLMDNLPSWKNYPKRSRGIICTTEPRYTYNYGNIFKVYPFDNSKIGICSETDVWLSFYKAFGRSFSVDDFNNLIFHFTKKTNLPKPMDYKSVIKTLEAIKEYLQDNEKISGVARQETKIVKEILMSNDSVEKALDKELSPKNNEFKMGIKNILFNREVWIQGEAILEFYDEFHKIWE